MKTKVFNLHQVIKAQWYLVLQKKGFWFSFWVMMLLNISCYLSNVRNGLGKRKELCTNGLVRQLLLYVRAMLYILIFTLQGSEAFLACSYLNYVFYIIYENFTIAYIAGVEGLSGNF